MAVSHGCGATPGDIAVTDTNGARVVVLGLQDDGTYSATVYDTAGNVRAVLGQREDPRPAWCRVDVRRVLCRRTRDGHPAVPAAAELLSRWCAALLLRHVRRWVATRLPDDPAGDLPRRGPCRRGLELLGRFHVRPVPHARLWR